MLRRRVSPPSQAQPLRDSKGQSTTARPSKVLAAANQVVVVGWSSMGLGHTGRVFAPIQLAAEDGTLRAGDVVIAYVPQPWGDEQKQISANKTLNHFRVELQKKGIKVAFVQADKTVRADYIGPDSALGKPGHSNNVAAMASFALQPYQDAPPGASIEWDELFEQTESLGDSLDQAALDRLPVAAASDVLTRLQASVDLSHTKPKRIEMPDSNDRNNASHESTGKPPPRIAVLTDMDPYLAKAACRAEIRSVSQSNHANLFSLPIDDSPVALKVATESNRMLFVWSKVEYGAQHGHIHAEISTSRNTLSGFKPTAKSVRENYGIDEHTSKADARSAVIRLFLAKGYAIAAKSDDYNGEPGIFVGDREPQNVVLLYTQGLTKEYGRHILKKMEEQDPNYCNTMFVVCAPGSFNGGLNALQVGMFANAGIVTAGGFGTTSEASYALEHGDYQGAINLRPVPFQREQEANASRMQERFNTHGQGSEMVAVSTDDDWTDQLDKLVARGLAEVPTGDMSRFFDAIDAQGSNAEHTKKLLFAQEEPTPREVKMNAALAASRNDTPTKANFRLLVKVLLPTLATIANNGGKLDQPLQFKITRSGPIHHFDNVDDLIAALGDRQRLSKLLQIDELGDFNAGVYTSDIVEALRKMKSKQEKIRAMDAKNLIRGLNERVAAGS